MANNGTSPRGDPFLRARNGSPKTTIKPNEPHYFMSLSLCWPNLANPSDKMAKVMYSYCHCAGSIMAALEPSGEVMCVALHWIILSLTHSFILVGVK